MISIFKAYKNGLAEAWNEKKMLFWMYGFNLLFAYLVTMPLSMMLSRALDKTTAAEKVLQAFDLTIFLTIMDDFGKGVPIHAGEVPQGDGGSRGGSCRVAQPDRQQGNRRG